MTYPAARPCRGTTRGTSTGRISVQCGHSEPAIFESGCRVRIRRVHSQTWWPGQLAMWPLSVVFSSPAIRSIRSASEVGAVIQRPSRVARPASRLDPAPNHRWSAARPGLLTLGKTTDQKGTNVRPQLRLCCEGFRYRNRISSSGSSSTRWAQVGQYHLASRGVPHAWWRGASGGARDGLPHCTSRRSAPASSLPSAVSS